jgi:hypothetical protein
MELSALWQAIEADPGADSMPTVRTADLPVERPPPEILIGLLDRRRRPRPEGCYAAVTI